MKNCGITAVNSKVLVGPIQMHRYVQASKKVKVDMQMPLFVFTGVVVSVAFPLQLLCGRVVVLSWLDVTNNNNSHSIIYALWECKRAFRLLSCLLLLFFLTAHHCMHKFIIVLWRMWQVAQTMFCFYANSVYSCDVIAYSPFISVFRK